MKTVFCLAALMVFLIWFTTCGIEDVRRLFYKIRNRVRYKKKQAALFAHEAFTVHDPVLQLFAFHQFMKWSGYKDYAINQQVLFKLQECGLLWTPSYELDLRKRDTGVRRNGNKGGEV
jgi:hypothetical protein